MKFRSRKQKPAVGMELTVTLSMSADSDAAACGASIFKFFEAVNAAAAATGAVWIKIHCSGIPDDLEATLQGALDKARNPAGLQIVVDNSGARGQSEK